ncbi:MAG: DUF2148 domain-containing protein [Candidatus Bathyarchaeota archaeon]
MPLLRSEDVEKDGVMQAAKLMAVSARTAPKSGGQDDILTTVVNGAEKDLVVAEMNKLGDERNREGFRRDAENVRTSEVIVLVGVCGNNPFGLNCGACGYASCEEFDKAPKKAGQDFIGGNCAFKVLDLGIALGSAVKTASMLNVDNRLMYRVGTAVKRLNMLPNASIIIGIPLSAKGKNIYFDRRV